MNGKRSVDRSLEPVEVPSSVVVPTVWGNHVCVRQAWDASGEVSGAGLDFLESDGRSRRDMESLEPIDALKVSIMLSQYAMTGLDSDARIELLSAATSQLMALRGASVGGIIPFPFHASSEASKTVSEEDPADGGVRAASSAGIVGNESGGESLESGAKITAGTAVPHSSDPPGECTCGTIIHSYRPGKYGNQMLDGLAVDDPLAAEMLSIAMDEGLLSVPDEEEAAPAPCWRCWGRGCGRCGGVVES